MLLAVERELPRQLAEAFTSLDELRDEVRRLLSLMHEGSDPSLEVLGVMESEEEEELWCLLGRMSLIMLTYLARCVNQGYLKDSEPAADLTSAGITVEALLRKILSLRDEARENRVEV